MKQLLGVIGLCMVLVGCTSFEKNARDSVAAANGVLVVLQRQYGTECKVDPTQAVCQKIKQGVAAQNLAIDSLEVYCSGPAFETGGACQPPDPTLKDAAQAKLNAAILALNEIVVDLKGVVKP